MDKMKKVPDIRFKGYEGEWNETPLCEYLCVSNEKNASCVYNKYDIYSVSREYGVINQIEYQGKSFAGASLTGYGIVHTWDVVYTKSPLKQQPYGIIKTNKTKNGIVSALYGIFTPNEKVDSNFVQTYFELDQRLNNYLRPLVNKGAKNTLLISDEDAIKGNVVFPKKEEQEKIVKMFNSLDYLIRKLEQKLEKLRNIKQSLLNQMFVNVNRGGYAPLIRFKGYADKWIMVLLKDFSKKVTEKNSSFDYKDVFTNSAELGIINQRDYFDHDVANVESIQGYYKVAPNDYVYNPRISTSAPVGPINRNKLAYGGVMSPLYYVFRVDDKDFGSLDFLDFFFKSDVWHEFMFKNGNSGARSDRFSISDDVFVEMPIAHPKSKREQKTIGNFLASMDAALQNETYKLTKLRTMKQSLLQKMFV